jgi:acyl dehydratase
VSFASHHLGFDQLDVGQEWESPGRTLIEADLVQFAGLSGDFNPIHVDHEFARSSPFRRPVAHGLLVLSLASGLLQHAPPARTLAFLEMRGWTFKAPVFAGDTLRVRSRVLEKHPRSKGRRGTVVWQVQVVNQVNVVVQEGTTVTLVEARTAPVLRLHDPDAESQTAA